MLMLLRTFPACLLAACVRWLLKVFPALLGQWKGSTIKNSFNASCKEILHRARLLCIGHHLLVANDKYWFAILTIYLIKRKTDLFSNCVFLSKVRNGGYKRISCDVGFGERNHSMQLGTQMFHTLKKVQCRRVGLKLQHWNTDTGPPDIWAQYIFYCQEMPFAFFWYLFFTA